MTFSHFVRDVVTVAFFIFLFDRAKVSERNATADRDAIFEPDGIETTVFSGVKLGVIAALKTERN